MRDDECNGTKKNASEIGTPLEETHVTAEGKLSVPRTPRTREALHPAQALALTKTIHSTMELYHGVG